MTVRLAPHPWLVGRPLFFCKLVRLQDHLKLVGWLYGHFCRRINGSFDSSILELVKDLAKVKMVSAPSLFSIRDLLSA